MFVSTNPRAGDIYHIYQLEYKVLAFSAFTQTDRCKAAGLTVSSISLYLQPGWHPRLYPAHDLHIQLCELCVFPEGLNIRVDLSYEGLPAVKAMMLDWLLSVINT